MQLFLSVEVFIQPDILRSFVGKPTEELPAALQHLLRPCDQQCYSRSGNTTPFMQSVLQQILRCPYQGVTKRVYLESKALELLALLLDQEVKVQTSNRPASVLKPGTLERIHYAREVLLQRLNDPPSIAELSKQVKLNEYTLKQGFRKVFGTTIFSYLHDYRLEQARLFFDLGEQNVIEIAFLFGVWCDG
ncbi:AraC family transcriptional regulator [Nostoc sp.]|uniref:AraC family transcriptional regulator n=1 Tax=Nostoc sp. TaxID=1180 RepID=UPI002FF83697